MNTTSNTEYTTPINTIDESNRDISITSEISLISKNLRVDEEPEEIGERWLQPVFNVSEVLNRMTPKRGRHAYDNHLKIYKRHGFIYNGPAINGVECDGAYCDEIRGSTDDSDPVLNVIFKLRGDNNTYTDFFLPGAPIARHFKIIGSLKNTIYITEDMESALQIYDITDYGVIVAHYMQNIPDICRTLIAESSEREIIVVLEDEESQHTDLMMRRLSEFSESDAVRFVFPPVSKELRSEFPHQTWTFYSWYQHIDASWSNPAEFETALNKKKQI